MRTELYEIKIIPDRRDVLVGRNDLFCTAHRGRHVRPPIKGTYMYGFGDVYVRGRTCDWEEEEVTLD